MIRKPARSPSSFTRCVIRIPDFGFRTFLPAALFLAAPALRAQNSGPHPAQDEADCRAVFAADSAPDRKDSEVIRLASQFLQAWPGSPLRTQVRMKLGQVYFRGEDFADAQTQFETLAQESPADPLAETALILAGESSVKSMSAGGVEHALDLYGRVAKAGGPLKLYALQEQAQVEHRMGRDQDAIAIYDVILGSSPNTPLRLAALCGKADCQVAARSAPASPSQSPSPGGSGAAAAIALYEQIAADPEATAPWRNHALYNKGQCLNQQGLSAEALAAFYDVLNSSNGESRKEQKQPDFFWFEKAGYDAAAILEASSQWPGAISILEKVARAGGPRSAEFQKRAGDLRREHFIWD